MCYSRAIQVHVPAHVTSSFQPTGTTGPDRCALAGSAVSPYLLPEADSLFRLSSVFSSRLAHLPRQHHTHTLLF